MSGADDPIRLRKAAAADGPALAEMFLETRNVSMAYLPSIRTTAETHAWMTDTILKTFDVHVATDGAKIVAFLALEGEHLGRGELLAASQPLAVAVVSPRHHLDKRGLTTGDAHFFRLACEQEPDQVAVGSPSSRRRTLTATGKSAATSATRAGISSLAMR